VLVLALDTTTRSGSLALWRGGIIDERVGDATRTHGERLPRDLGDLMAAAGVAPAEIDLYAVAAGPGSFTGLRVGIATMQGLALVHGKRIVGVSALEALAYCGARAVVSSTDDPTLIAWMEAYRGEVFAALYVRGAASSESASSTPPLVLVEGPTVGSPAAIARQFAARRAAGRAASEGAEPERRPPSEERLTLRAKQTPGALAAPSQVDTVVIGDGMPATEPALREAFGPRLVAMDAPPLAGMIATLAAMRAESAVAPHAIVPLYVRVPDAELTQARTMKDRKSNEIAGEPSRERTHPA
jgi:tRNA threonylcarbamoyladenosine biosynthesis protein TsaB